MSGGGGPIIILKNIRSALSVGATPSGGVKLWHCVLAFGLICFVAGALVF